MKKIEFYEPAFFIFFGIFHLHRIWGIIDRYSYANFWIGCLEEKGILYFSLMGLLIVLCIIGMITFFRNFHNNFWWRWIYFVGGAYLLFDLFAIALGWEFWNLLILKMFDVTSSYWNYVWSVFILIGVISFTIGTKLLIERGKHKTELMSKKREDNKSNEKE